MNAKSDNVLTSKTSIPKSKTRIAFRGPRRRGTLSARKLKTMRRRQRRSAQNQKRAQTFRRARGRGGFGARKVRRDAVDSEIKNASKVSRHEMKSYVKRTQSQRTRRRQTRRAKTQKPGVTFRVPRRRDAFDASKVGRHAGTKRVESKIANASNVSRSEMKIYT